MDASRYEYRVAWSEEDDVFIGRVTEFSLLAAHGDTEEEALREIRFVVQEVLEDLKEKGEAVPPPLSTRKYSGKINLRMPEYLHRDLVMEAARQGISLNQLILLRLSPGSRV